MDGYILSQGIVVESDQVSLSPHFQIKAGKLYDLITGAEHVIHSPGDKLLQKLQAGVTMSTWRKEALRLHISEAELALLFTNVHDVGGIQVKRNIAGWSKWLLMVITSWRYGFWPRPRITTTTGTVRNIVVQVGLAMRWLFFLAPIMFILFYGYGLSVPAAAGIIVYALACLWLTTVIHELTHWWLLGKYKTQSVFIRKGLRIGILHKPARATAELMSAILGPVTGASGAALLGWLGAVRRIGPGAWPVALSCSLFHLCSLLPAYGDGSAIINSLRYIHARKK